MITTFIPQRTCIGCRKKADKKELIRIVKTTSNEVSIDDSGSSDGRGAYVCRNIDCVNNAVKRGALKRALKCEIDDIIYRELLELLENGKNL